MMHGVDESNWTTCHALAIAHHRAPDLPWDMEPVVYDGLVMEQLGKWAKCEMLWNDALVIARILVSARMGHGFVTHVMNCKTDLVRTKFWLEKAGFLVESFMFRLSITWGFQRNVDGVIIEVIPRAEQRLIQERLVAAKEEQEKV